MTSLTCQTLLDIAKVLKDIEIEDLSKAEMQIFKLLCEAGVMETHTYRDPLLGEISVAGLR